MDQSQSVQINRPRAEKRQRLIPRKIKRRRALNREPVEAVDVGACSARAGHVDQIRTIAIGDLCERASERLACPAVDVDRLQKAVWKTRARHAACLVDVDRRLRGGRLRDEHDGQRKGGHA
jgi:hypothetical protein